MRLDHSVCRDLGVEHALWIKFTVAYTGPGLASLDRNCLEGQGNLVSRLISLIAIDHIDHIVTLVIPVLNPLTKSP